MGSLSKKHIGHVQIGFPGDITDPKQTENIMTKDDKTLLIFSAHPDDHLGCAGTAIRLKELGFKIVEVVFTGGEKSVDKTQTDSAPVDKTKLKQKRLAEYKKAAAIIGIDEFEFLGLPNNNIQRSGELIDRLIKIIRKYKPTIVISESPNDYHVDHQAIGNIVPEAVKRAGWGVSKELGKPHKTVVGLFMGSKIENKRSDFVVDITTVTGKKNAVLGAYNSQMGTSGVQLTQAVDMYTGFKIRKPFAESFQLMSNFSINMDSLLEASNNDK